MTRATSHGHVCERRETFRLFLEPFSDDFHPPSVRPFPNETRQQREFKGDCSSADPKRTNSRWLFGFNIECRTRLFTADCFSPERVFLLKEETRVSEL